MGTVNISMKGRQTKLLMMYPFMKPHGVEPRKLHDVLYLSYSDLTATEKWPKPLHNGKCVVQAACAVHYFICNERLVALLHVILFIMLLKATAAALRHLQGKDQLCYPKQKPSLFLVVVRIRRQNKIINC